MYKIGSFRNSILNTAIVPISLCIGLIICEGLLRIAPVPHFDASRSDLFRPHLTRGFEFVPNVSAERWGFVWHTNSEGFRDYEHAIAKRGFRIVALGDSFFVGHEVSFEDSFLRRLEHQLGLEVVKLAVSNYGTIQEYRTWEEVGKKYKPDLVLLGVFVGNDLEDNAEFPDSTCVDGGYLVRCGDTSYAEVRAARSLAEHSLLGRLVLQRFVGYLPRRPYSQLNTAPDQPEVFRNLNHPNAIYRKNWDHTFTVGYELLTDSILKLRKSAAAQRAELIVILIPTELQIYDWEWDEYIRDFSLNAGDYDRDRVLRLLSGFLTSNRIRAIDLQPALRRAGESDRNLHPQHLHWSVAANELVGGEVENYLRSNHLVRVETQARKN